MPSFVERPRTWDRKPVNWLNASARWPLEITSSELLDESVELGAREVRRGSASTQRRMEAQLAHARDRLQDREAVAVEVVEQPQDLLPLALQVGVVQLAVTGVQLHLERCSCFGGSSAATSSFVRRLSSGLIRRRRRAIRSASLPALDRPGVVLGEAHRVGKQPGRGDRQQRPQLHQVVLHRRAGDRQLERRVQAHGRPVRLRRGGS